MKKSRTRKAVEFLARQDERLRPVSPKDLTGHSVEEKRESVYAVAKRFKLDPAGLSRAWKRFRTQKRCKECGQVMR